MSAPRFTRLEDWLAWQETCHPSAIDLGLERVFAVAERLDAQLSGALLKGSAKRIVVAGTNGKGSCVASLAAILSAQGKSCGVYSSPHILRYNERININGQPAQNTQLCAAFAAVDAARGDISLTYFEFGTLAAFWLFAQQPLDYWLLEVGLGGRLDAVNILDADLAIITAIDLDHQAWLGNTREDIGREKAGICRPGRPVICVDSAPPASLVAHIQALACPSVWLGQALQLQEQGASWCFTLANGWQMELARANLHLPAPSVAAALQAAAHFGELPEPAEAAALFARTRLQGRMQTLQVQGVEVVLDVAHNPASMAYLAKRLAELSSQPCFAVLGMMADKDIASSLRPLLPLCHTAWCCSLQHNPRAATAETLAQVATGMGASVQACATIADALDQALAAAQAQSGRVLVCGSFFTLAEAFAQIEQLEVISG